MGDRIDDVMTKRWPDLSKHVSDGLGVKPSLNKYVPVESFGEARPYRIDSMTWEPALPDGLLPQLRRCVPAFKGALELLLSLTLRVDDLENEIDSVRDQVRDFSQKAREREREVLLLLLAQEAREVTPYTLDAVADGVDSLKKPCRLIAASGDVTAKKAVEQGIVEDRVDPQTTFPTGVQAMLLKLGRGPGWYQVDGDLTPTWQRVAVSKVELRLSERFFL
ncbi:MAG TPA: hypothetical protein VFY54_16470, partial [Rubrobacter sp.]|nr:hypothetical protein [Rubrobacter sp.]